MKKKFNLLNNNIINNVLHQSLGANIVLYVDDECYYFVTIRDVQDRKRRKISVISSDGKDHYLV
jgi:hypothetical protein